MQRTWIGAVYNTATLPCVSSGSGIVYNWVFFPQKKIPFTGQRIRPSGCCNCSSCTNICGSAWEANFIQPKEPTIFIIDAEKFVGIWALCSILGCSHAKKMWPMQKGRKQRMKIWNCNNRSYRTKVIKYKLLEWWMTRRKWINRTQFTE